MGEGQQAQSMFSFKFTRKHMYVIAVLVLAFVTAFMVRSMPLQYGFYLNEFDPYFDYRATKFLVENGVDAYFSWHDTMSWYPEGRDVASTSQTGLHLSAAYLYNAFGGGMPLYDFVVWFPVVFGSLTVIVMFALVRVISSTTAGLFASLLLAFSPAIVQRGNLGWFKSEPLGLFLSLLAVYLLLSALKQREQHFAIPKAVVGGLMLGFAMTAWGGIQYFNLLLGIFFVAIPFFMRDRKSWLYIVPIFTMLTVASASSFPRPGESFAMSLAGLSLIGPMIFLVAAYFVGKFSKAHQIRNMLGLLAAFVIGAGAFIGAGSYISPSFRYISAINPFSKTEIPLVESVAEHFTPTIVDYFASYSVLILLAGYGVMLCFKKRNDMAIFALILGITGIYVSASFTRLLVYASIAIITLASIALFEITTAIFAKSAEAPVTQAKKKVKIQTQSKDFRITYTALIIAMLFVPIFYPPGAGWIAGADFPASIANGATGFKVSTDDWTDMMQWIKENTEKDAVIASWWDYGYWITTLGERTSLADNATVNMTRIEQIAKAFVSDEQTGIKILKDLKADYVLVYMVGQRVAAQEGNNFLVLGGGGDESKKHWFMRIAGVDEFKFIEEDGFTPTPFFWNSTLLGNMFPVQPAAYVRLDEEGRPADLQAEYKPGYAPLYLENVKYPINGTGSLKLVHASPSFMNKNSTIVLGVLLYKISEGPVTPIQPTEPEKPEEIKLPEIERDKAVLEISMGGKPLGEITIELYPDVAPKTVESFENLINSGFYNGIKIHRIVPNFVIQGGDPNTKDKDKSTWGTGGPGYFLPAEISQLSHTRGMVSMAHPGDPNRAGSQFFIVVKDSTFLDGKYSIFGKVSQGMDIVDEIVKQPRDDRDVPETDIVIEKAYIIKAET
jgi:dolichyl-diphosphooligosaccharide--protein glycosyltransferase